MLRGMMGSRKVKREARRTDGRKGMEEGGQEGRKERGCEVERGPGNGETGIKRKIRFRREGGR